MGVVTLVFLVAAAMALGGSIGIILSRDPIRSVLSLVMVMIALSGLFLLLSAQFIFAVQIIVYAGAVMVLFLFVIALLGPAREVVTTPWGEWRRRHPRTTVLSLDTGHVRDYDEGEAYRLYFATDALMFPVPGDDTRVRSWDGDAAVTDGSGTVWTLTETALVSAEKRLPRLSSHNTFWFGWRAAHPDIELVAGDGTAR